MNNPERHVWITETALATTLNASYMARADLALWVAVGAAFLLVAAAFAAFGLVGVRLPRVSLPGWAARTAAVQPKRRRTRARSYRSRSSTPLAQNCTGG